MDIKSAIRLPLIHLFIVYPMITICEWKHTTVSLPFPMSSQQIAYNNPYVYLFGDNPSGKGTLKWNISNINNDWEMTNDEPPSFSSNSQSSVTIKNIAYFIGIETPTNNGDIFMFDLISQQWITNISIPKMKYPAINGCVSTNYTHIFMIGGLYNDTSLDKSCYLQTYDMENNKWMNPQNIPFIKAMNWSNQMCSMVNNTLYAFGGLYNNKNIANIAYKYNTQTEEWKFITNMSKPLHNGWSVYYNKNKTIYIIGGSSDTAIQHEIKIFNVTCETFIGYDKMIDNVENAASIIVSDNVFVFGGHTSNGKLSSIQISELPLKVVSSDVVTTIYWRIIVFASAMVGFILCCCCVELRISNKNKIINKDPLIIQNDMNKWDKTLND